MLLLVFKTQACNQTVHNLQTGTASVIYTSHEKDLL
jgi:hypothetical protein